MNADELVKRRVYQYNSPAGLAQVKYIGPHAFNNHKFKCLQDGPQRLAVWILSRLEVEADVCELGDDRQDSLVGHKVVGIRKMSAAELDAEGWEDIQGTVVTVLFDNGTKLYASQDPEGNGPGALFGKTKAGTGFCLG
jgi:hypothetical protein